MSRNKLYITVSILALTGYAWLLINGFSLSGSGNAFSVCLIKNTTGIPCPSCGSTRSAVSILHGKWIDGVLINPLGGLIVIALAVVPPWITMDFWRGKNSFFDFYNSFERLIRKKYTAIPAAALIILNWVWNIYKNL